MTFIDISVIKFLNQFAAQSCTFDYIMALLSDFSPLKGGIFSAMLWWGWFQRKGDRTRNQELVLTAVISSFVAIIIARLLAHSLPFHNRPIHVPNLMARYPCSMKSTIIAGWIDWSSFPSDHAVMFFALATGLLFIFGRSALWWYLYVIVVICFPRLYLGLHFPSDLFAGALLGILITFVIYKTDTRKLITTPLLKLSDRYPGPFYACYFLLTYEIATMFSGTRTIGSYLFKIVR